MPLAFHPMDEASARAILSWRYDPPYDVYNLRSDEADDVVGYFLDPQNNFHRITDERGNLVACCSFGPDGQVPGGDYAADALDIGLGLRPDLTGQGRGLDTVNSVLDFARLTFAPGAFRVTVAEFNQRALRVWERAGFHPVQTFRGGRDQRAFVVLIREKS
jgi:ribosomal-protein-alanine N-acetyltransferase